MFKQIALFVFVPLIAGLTTQSIMKNKYGEQYWIKRLKPKFPPFSAFGVILIAFVAMSLKAKSIIANPGGILIILAPLAVFYLISYVFLSIVGRLFFQRGDAIAMVFGVVMRDLSIALAIAMTAFGKQGFTIALLIALAYVIQIQSAAWYVKLVDTIFGKAMGKTDSTKAREPDQTLVLSEEIPDRLPVEEHAMVPDIKRILYATDLSDTARHAVRYACSIGHKYGAKVTLLHVIPDIVEEISIGTGINLIDHMGTHGHGKLGQSIIGSVAGEVIRRCSRPVMVVRLPEHDYDMKKEWHDSSDPGSDTHRQAA